MRITKDINNNAYVHHIKSDSVVMHCKGSYELHRDRLKSSKNKLKCRIQLDPESFTPYWLVIK